MDISRKFEGTYSLLKKIARKSIDEKKYEKALEAISSAAWMAYLYNQFYSDNELESMLLKIGKENIHFSNWNQNKKSGRIVFYDGFGFDRRGVSIVMNKAICLNGYKLTYISPLKTKNSQPTLQHELSRYEVDWRFIDTDGDYITELSQIQDVFEDVKPQFAFLYTMPSDVTGITVFNELKGRCIRCQIDLTDHAFWLGLNAFDVCNGGRDFSASIQHFYRGIPFDKMTLLDANLFIDDCAYKGLPFSEDNRFVFSGGSLYKTLGDKNNTFYKIIEKMLEKHSDVMFLYAGSGDESQMNILISKFPDRVFLIHERPDFYQIMKRCTFYLNTYPMFGGLMMRYAVLAGKLPLTLKHGNDSDGILIDQEKRQIEYDSFEMLSKDIDNLLSDKEYLKQREQLLSGAVVTEDCYVRNIKMLIEEQKTEFSYDKIEKVDTTQFRKEYLERFVSSYIYDTIATKKNRQILVYFPKALCYKVFTKFFGKKRKK